MTRRDSDPSLCLGRVLFVVAVVTIVLALVAFGPVGCAAGRGPAGEVIVGAKVGQLVETAGEAARAAAAFLPPPFDLVATGALSLLAGGGIAGARARRQGERDGWEEAAAVYSPPPAGAGGGGVVSGGADPVAPAVPVSQGA